MPIAALFGNPGAMALSPSNTQRLGPLAVWGSDLLVWCRADSIETNLNATENVEKFLDKSGNGYDYEWFTGTNPSPKGTLIEQEPEMNNRPVVRSQLPTNQMAKYRVSAANEANVQGLTAHFAAVVGKAFDDSNSRWGQFYGVGGEFPSSYMRQNGQTLELRAGSDTASLGQPAWDQWNCISVNRDDSSPQTNVTGRQVNLVTGTDDLVAISPNDYQAFSTPGAGFRGYVAEWVLVGREATAQEINDYLDYLFDYYLLPPLEV